MKPLSFAILIALAAPRGVCAQMASASDGARDSIVLRVIMTNDVHGYLEPQTPDWAKGKHVGGAPALKAWMDTLAARCGCASLRVDAGDEFQGTLISNLAFGRPVVEAFNRMGYAAAAVGNHEFDWGIDTLRARIRESAYPWLSANIVEKATGTVPPWLRQWTMVEREGIKIALIGVTTTETPTATRPSNVASLRFLDEAAAIRGVLPDVRAAHPDFVIVLAHAGAFCKSSCDGEVVTLAQRLDSGSVDLIVSGHTHSLVETTVNGIPIIQAHAHGTDIGVVDFVRRADGGRTAHLRDITVDDAAVTPDSALSALLVPFAAAAASAERRPITVLRAPMSRPEGEEYALGHLIADAYRDTAHADVGLINNFGMRADLPGGEVTFGDLYLVQPFNNEIVRVTVTGADLLAVLEHVVSHGAPSAHVSGITVRYDPHGRSGHRIREVRFTDGTPLDPQHSYTLAVPDFLADGGSGYAMLKDLPHESLGVADVDAVARYLRRLTPPVAVSSVPRFIVAP